MKFGKHFCSQMVPEWHEAYLDYNALKHILKNIPERKKTADPPEPNSNGLARAHTLYWAFSGLTNQGSRSIKVADIENQVILVNSVRRDGAEASETTFLNAGDEGGEHELEYFRRLDDEFFKVSKFYQKKVKEVVEEAQGLNKQMNALIAFRVKVDHPDGSWLNSMIESVELASNVEASAAMLAVKSPSAARAASRKIAMDVIEEEDSETMRDMEESNEESEESKPSDDIETGKEMKAVENSDVEENKQNHFKSKRSVPLEILEQIKLNTNLGTPRSMIKGFLNLPSQKDLDFSKTSLHKAKEQLRMAFVEFYQKLRLLKNYGFLNILAISKIMKKYDKITSRSASKSYMKMVDNSYLGTSEEVNRLIERVEATFIKHFTNSDRSLGMKCLRPTAKKERHRTTFTTGFLVGCAVSLVLALALIVRAHDILDRAGRNVYMETMFPLYSLFGFIVLHMVMYGVNIYFWRRYRVNYSFIFGFKQGTELGYREVFLVSFSIGVLALASVLANLDMEMDPVTKDYQAITELLPLGIVVLLIAIVLCPLNIMYRSSRFFLLRTLTRCVFAPLYKVTLPDFMLADQLTSQVQAIRSLQFYVCYYFWGDYKRRENHCSSNDIFISFSFFVAIVPFWWRVAQCLRRWTEEKDIMQAYNGIKYFMTIVAVCSRTTYSLNGANSWKYMALVTSIGATTFSTYWDLVIDWGLLQPNSKNRWLRDKLLVPYKSVYFIAIVLDVILRLAWMQTVMKLFTFDLHRQTIIAIMASLEIIRRGIWNFFRLENEHLNNVGKFRAFKSLPLPFNCDCDGKNN